MIDPVEAVIRLLSEDAALAELVGTRIAAKHRYGHGWKTTESGVMVRPDGGIPALYVPLHQLRFEVRCYAADQETAIRVWQRLVEISRETDRARVAVSGGRALVYRFLMASEPSLLFDAEADLDFALCFFETAVAEDAVA